MHRTRPTPSTSQIHSVATPLRNCSWLRSGIRVSSSDSTSFGPSDDSPSSIWTSPSTRTDGRACDDKYNVDAPRAAAIRNSRSRPDIPLEVIGGGVSVRIGLRDIGSTTAGCGGATKAAGAIGGGVGAAATGGAIGGNDGASGGGGDATAAGGNGGGFGTGAGGTTGCAGVGLTTGFVGVGGTNGSADAGAAGWAAGGTMGGGDGAGRG